MIIRDFTPGYIEEATEIALGAYNHERTFVQELPEVSGILVLKRLSENGFGVAAFESKKMVGFLCSVEPFEAVFRSTDVRGVFSPMGANGAITEDHSRIYAAMYQEAAKKWVKAGAVSHAVCLYAHDEEAKQQFFRYGFGLRCIDAVRPISAVRNRPVCKTKRKAIDLAGVISRHKHIAFTVRGIRQPSAALLAK